MVRDVERLTRENERLRQELIERDRKLLEAEKQISEAEKQIADLERKLALRLQNSVTSSKPLPMGWLVSSGPEEGGQGRAGVSPVDNPATVGTGADWRRRIGWIR